MENVLHKALDEGAKAVEGGGRLSQFNKGWFVAPTVLVDCNDEMSIFNNESFGPVAPICKVSSFEEAMEKANNSRPKFVKDSDSLTEISEPKIAPRAPPAIINTL